MSVLRSLHVVLLTVALASALCAAGAWAQQLFIYPLRGQSPQQQQQDRFECHQWAAQQTGFDPCWARLRRRRRRRRRRAPCAGPRAGPPSGRSGAPSRADAGRGAAIGAGTGALFGTMRRNDQIRQGQAQQAAHAQQTSWQMEQFNRALAACLQGRGYTVN